jgi:hypothetical protein
MYKEEKAKLDELKATIKQDKAKAKEERERGNERVREIKDLSDKHFAEYKKMTEEFKTSQTQAFKTAKELQKLKFDNEIRSLKDQFSKEKLCIENQRLRNENQRLRVDEQRSVHAERSGDWEDERQDLLQRCQKLEDQLQALQAAQANQEVEEQQQQQQQPPPPVEPKAVTDLQQLRAMSSGGLITYDNLSPAVQQALRSWVVSDNNKLGEDWYELVGKTKNCCRCPKTVCRPSVRDEPNTVCIFCFYLRTPCIRRHNNNIVLFPLSAGDRKTPGVTEQQVAYWILPIPKRKSESEYDTQGKRAKRAAASGN